MRMVLSLKTARSIPLCNENVAFQAEVATTGEQGRPRFIIAKDPLEFLLDFWV